MDAFERVVVSLLEREGFWVRSSIKVELTKAEKVQIGRHSSPRWELDVVAYKPKTNELWVVECKSYLDSRGVQICAFNGKNEGFAKRFKLFCEPRTREVVFHRLEQQLLECGAIRKNPKIKLCLAAGRIATAKDRDALRTHFSERGWILWDEEWIAERLATVAKGGYENDVTAVVAKLLLRGTPKKLFTQA
ncbi:MAG TPA: hypothetical protein VGI40_25925 [Pirellulaceae bacterium]|jgi:hypothetical protein